MRGLVKTLVFDVSGVLRDSKRVMKRAYDVSFAEHGLDIDVDADMVYKLRGLNAFNDLSNSIRLLVGTGGDVNERVVMSKGANKLLTEEMHARPVDEALVAGVRARFRAEFAAAHNAHLVELLPGVADGLDALARDGYTLGVLSNSTLPSLQRDLGHLSHHFRFMIPDAAKPSPDVYARSLREHDLLPAETAYVGDALSDVDLARVAGSPSIAVLTGMGTRKHLEAAAPDLLCDDFPHLVNLLTKEA
eukprot:Rhum_TRINITY_DN14826_c6_g1::Rhum_TRINITY_DN14826_c6_g1_i1::g.121068::m.121068/K01091/gph; phosphoglycolate phosphatase